MMIKDVPGMIYELDLELTEYARKAKSRDDIVSVDVVRVYATPPFWLIAKIGDNDEARSWITPLDDDVPSSKGFIDNIVASGRL